MEFQEEWEFPDDSIEEGSVSRETRHEEYRASDVKTRKTTNSGYSECSYDDEEDKTDNEAYIDGWVTAEEEIYSGAEPGSYLPVEGSDDYESDYDDGYGY